MLEPNILSRFISDLNEHLTVLYIYGFLDMATKLGQEFNFLTDKVKIGDLHLSKIPITYLLATLAIPEGIYFLETSSSWFYSIGSSGIQPYLDGIVVTEKTK